MRRPIAIITIVLVIAICAAPRVATAQQADTLRVGQTAPDFTIPSTVGIPEGTGTVGIRAITAGGKAVVLAFFPRAFTGG
jgi:hypothetical protein